MALHGKGVCPDDDGMKTSKVMHIVLYLLSTSPDRRIFFHSAALLPNEDE